MIKVANGVVHVDTPKNEDTWCEELGHFDAELYSTLNYSKRILKGGDRYGRLFVRSRSTAIRTSSMLIVTTMAGGSTRIGLTLTTTGATMVRLLGPSRNFFHFSPDFLSGEFCFMICPCQPPSCLPATASGSDNAVYFLVSNALISQSIYKRNFRVSREIIAFLTNGCFSCFSKKLATKILSIVWIKYLSIVSAKVYREVFGIVGI